MAIASTMQDASLTVTGIFRHGRRIHAESQCSTLTEDGLRRASFGDIAARAGQLAHGLRALGVQQGERVATFSWNHQEHLETYFAVPCMGAVLHTLNIRLFADQIAYIVNHAEDAVLLVDHDLLALLEPLAAKIHTVKHVVVIGGRADDAPSDLPPAVAYEDLLADQPEAYPWPELDERSGASMCYTSGTTGNPKGVVYGHRSTFVHALAQCAANSFAISEPDRILAVVPMFHANAWGLPYSAWMAGADLVLPGPRTDAPTIARTVAAEAITFTAGVPTLWNDLLAHADEQPVDLSSLRVIVSGGSAVPESLIAAYRERFGIPILQGWGMTETSPLAALSAPPKQARADQDIAYRARSGRPVAGVELRIVDSADGELPWDDESVGELEVRGPWVTNRYYRDDASEKFHDGWLRTGDVGRIDARGYVQITDRAKDVIKSGGEWISSVELENLLMAHPDVVEATVVAAPDPRWQERPLACVVIREGATVTPEDLRAFLQGRITHWWLPERWCFLDEVPKTSVGKFNKRLLRDKLEQGKLDIITV